MDTLVTFQSWDSMMRRCYDPTHPAYPNYGGREIVVCERWKDFRTYRSDLGARPDGMSLDRTDNDGPYSPENCAWATSQDQNRNKRNNHRLTFNGETRCLTEWARIVGLNTTTLTARLKTAWSVEIALTSPLRPKRANLWPSSAAPRRTILQLNRLMQSWRGPTNPPPLRSAV